MTISVTNSPHREGVVTPSLTVRVRYLGGPTAILEIGGIRLITDPTFDAPGNYRVGDLTLTKTMGPALSPDQLDPVDVVLLSHDQHLDNLDHRGRAYLSAVPRVLSTASARDRLGAGVEALSHWGQTEVSRPGGGVLRVSGVPARHGPASLEHLMGEVTGFVLSGENLPTIYVSGDNASLDIVREISRRVGTVDAALLFAGGARRPHVGKEYLTLPSELAAEAVRILDVRHAIPIHFEGWTHLTQGADTLRETFDQAGLADRLHLLESGEAIDL